MLTRLELAGFKSFAAPTEFTFGPGLTAIVGPNGSGKSNVVDAIRWVLGEQSARSLRGAGMADVIFAGTPRSPARTFAEVSLTLSNHRKQLATEAEEVRITRRVHLDGRGEYLLNGQPVRLRDVKDLLLGSGTGCGFIAQGQVDALLQASGEQRRLAIEEAAGIARLRARREEAGQKLVKVQENLARLAELRAGQGRQLASVRQQAAKARRYLALREELRTTQRQFFRQEGHRLTAALHQARDCQQQALAALEAARLSVRKLEGAVAQDERQFAAAAGQCRDLERLLAELRIEAATLAGQRQLEEERRELHRAEEAKAISQLQVRLAVAEEARAAAEAAARSHSLAGTSLDLARAEAIQAELVQREQAARLRLAAASARCDTLREQAQLQPWRVVPLAELPAWQPPPPPEGCRWAAEVCHCDEPHGKQLLDFLLAGVLLVPHAEAARSVSFDDADVLWVRTTQELRMARGTWPAEGAGSLQAAEAELRLAQEEWTQAHEQARQSQEWNQLLKTWRDAEQEKATAATLLAQAQAKSNVLAMEPAGQARLSPSHELNIRWTECQTRQEQAAASLQFAEAERNAAEAQRKESALQLEEARHAADSCRQSLYHAELALQRAADHLAALEARVAGDLQAGLGELLAEQPSTCDVVATAEQCAELRQQLDRLGGVNLDALAELERLEPEAQQLEAQHADLHRAKETIEALLCELDEESRQAYLATLAVVRREFQAIFARLFGGGSAEIHHAEDVDPLRAGIELVARPPGKEPRTLNLLSGGEKSLTAVAFLLALFRARPSPFCIMDEVDAALDEANVARLADLLREFAADCQFILVSHSRRTLTAADVLFGVTMQEPGVSTRVAVRLNSPAQLRFAA